MYENDFLHLKPLQKTDGNSLLPYWTQNHFHTRAQPFFIETADRLGEMETDKIDVQKVIKKMLPAYRVNLKNGLLFLDPLARQSIIATKERAVIMGDWLLAWYPPAERLRLERNKKQPVLEIIKTKPYFIVMNLKTKRWTIGFSSSFAKQAPFKMLLGQLQSFYGDEKKF